MGLRQKRPRIKLSPTEYLSLHNQVLERDRWRCQSCGSAKNLHVHHLRARSKLGDDTLQNLITLCIDCHTLLHRRLRLPIAEPKLRS
jgi:5-methylcytosine-specific restriction endonuclease McrA